MRLAFDELSSDVGGTLNISAVPTFAIHWLGSRIGRFQLDNPDLAMDPVIQSFLAGFPILLLHFAVTLAMLVIGVTIYQFVTPYHELRLIRNGNTAAAVSFSGAIIGLAIPLAICMATSVNVWDIVIWGIVTLLIQILAYRIGDSLLKDLPTRIESGEIGAAILWSKLRHLIE